MHYPGIRAFWNSHVAVGLFFILSGFVLPLNFFKKHRSGDPNAHDSIINGTFRRYIRLMIPVMTAYSIYFFCGKVGMWNHDSNPGNYNNHVFKDIFKDGIYKTWFGQSNWIGATWTLEFELLSTFFVYLLAQTVVEYRFRWVIYWLACHVMWRGTSKFSPSNLQIVFFRLPQFFSGVLYADLETMENPPLNFLR